MIDVLLYISFVLILAYCGLLLYLFSHWSSLDDTEAGEFQFDSPSVSVIVAMRNEAENAAECINALLGQSYAGEYEVIVVDDHSEDGTSEIIEIEFGKDERVKLIRLEDKTPGKGGKKHAIATAIELSTGELIATTDGDCIVSRNWLGELVGAIGEERMMSTGPVLQKSASGIFDYFQAQDLMALALVTGAGISTRKNILANGGSLAFRRTAYERVGGYSGHTQYASGDDVFLVQEIAREYGEEAVAYVKSPHCVVWTKPEANVSSFIEQRIRWASKNRAIPNASVHTMWAFVWIVNVLIAAAGVWIFFDPEILLAVVAAVTIKLATEYVVLRGVARFYDISKMMNWFSITYFINMIYVTSIGLLANFKQSYTWKGRDVS